VAYGRQTDRQRAVLKRIGYALGGEAGFRLASQLAIDGSADTILRVLKRDIRPLSDTSIKALGVEDWAWRRGQRYGTILVDLERRAPVDLLPDRESETLEKWLEAHPGVEIISRDRAGAYAEGARKGAPEAVQVADRFHILCNLTQALQRLLERLSVSLRKIQPGSAPAEESPTGSDSTAATDDPISAKAISASVQLNRHERESQQRRERRKTRFEAVRDAFQRGMTQRAIARELGLSRKTVGRFLRAEKFPEQAPRSRRTGLEPFREYLEKRWAEGCHNAARLWRELREQGYTGQSSRVKGFLQAWRSHGPTAAPRKRKLPGMRLVAFWLTKPAEKRKEAEQEWVQAVTKNHPDIATAEALAQAFREMVKNRKAGDLDGWLESAEASGIQELNGFASGIRRDHDAVVAGIEKSWSNGQVEGQVHRLKLLKRQMYGRSGFLLLRTRVLPFHIGVTDHRTRSP
jgi:transposase